MGFSPRASLRAWFVPAGRRRVCGLPPASRWLNNVEQRPNPALHLLSIVLPALRSWGRLGIWPVVVLLLISVRQAAAVSAGPPLLPAAFYGSVTPPEQTPVSADIVVIAAIDGVEYARGAIFQNGDEWVYTLKVPADNPSTDAVDGGRPGDTVTFSIGGETLGTAAWQGGSNTQVNLSLTSETEPPSDPTNNSAAWLPWLLVAAAFFLIGVFWLFVIRPRMGKN